MIILAILGCLKLFPLVLTDNTHLDYRPRVPESQVPTEDSFICGEGLSRAFTIENDVYLAEDFHSKTNRYNAENGTFKMPIYAYFGLFDKWFQEIHAIVPLSGFCHKSPLCTDPSWNELEKLVIVHGRIFLQLEKPDYEGFLLAERSIDDGSLSHRKFKLLTRNTTTQNVLEKMRKLNLTIANHPYDWRNSWLMSIPTKLIWDSKQSTNKTGCLGAVFVPSRSEMLVLVNNFPDYPANLFQLTLLRRKFTAFGSEGSKWDRFLLSEMDLDLDVKLVGLISINQTVYAIGWDSELFDVVWGDQDQIGVKQSLNKTKLISSCVERNSSVPFEIPFHICNQIVPENRNQRAKLRDSRQSLLPTIYTPEPKIDADYFDSDA